MGGCPPTDRRLPPGLWAVAPQLMGGCPRAYGRLPSALWAVAPQSKFGVVGPCARTLQVRSERDSRRHTGWRCLQFLGAVEAIQSGLSYSTDCLCVGADDVGKRARTNSC